MRPPKPFFIPFLILAALAAFSYIVMLLWNGILSPVLEINTITFWQAVGIFILGKILFGFKPYGGRSPGKWKSHRHRWRSMSAEEKSHFRDRWKQRCEPGNDENEKK